MPLLQSILHLLLLLNSGALSAVAELLGIPVHHHVFRIVDCAFQPVLIIVFVAMDLHDALLFSDKQQLGLDMVTFYSILAFLIGSYATGFFWAASLDLLAQLTDGFIHSTTVAVAVTIPHVEHVVSVALGQVRGLREYARAVISTGALLALAVACHHSVAAHVADFVLYCLVFTVIGTFLASAIALVAAVSQCFLIIGSCVVEAFLKKSGAPEPTTCITRNVQMNSSPLDTQSRNQTRSHSHSSASGSSTPSIIPSNSSGQPSRPSTRTSVSEGATDHENCLNQIRILQMAIGLLADENFRLSAEKTDVVAENVHLKNTNEGLRRQAFRAEENFEEHCMSMKHLEAANAELCVQLQDERRSNSDKDAEFDERIKEFIRLYFPRHKDISSPKSTAAPSSPAISSTLATPQASVAKFISAIASDGSSLPFEPPNTPTQISVNSKIKPSRHRYLMTSNSASPLVGYANSNDVASSLNDQMHTPPYAQTRAKRFSNYLDFEPSPATVSSCLTLPVPSPSNTTSTRDPFI
ncbi:hypothetical protein IWZ03DRAFT_409958 [Phyllosticta citriasiana]|uniref:Transmembrane protein n=1 Tax=Phyllosticta citriasiana TaxID=595635 RepID=A0ABR1K7X4_9PEZI